MVGYVRPDGPQKTCQVWDSRTAVSAVRRGLRRRAAAIRCLPRERAAGQWVPRGADCGAGGVVVGAGVARAVSAGRGGASGGLVDTYFLPDLVSQLILSRIETVTNLPRRNRRRNFSIAK